MKKKIILSGIMIITIMLLSGCQDWQRRQAELNAQNEAQIAVMEAEYNANVMRLDAEARLYYEELNAESILLAAEAEAQAMVIYALAQADVDRIQAEVSAYYVLNVARAQAEANQLLGESLNAYIIQSQWIDAWRGHVPTISADGSGLILDVSDFLRDDSNE